MITKQKFQRIAFLVYLFQGLCMGVAEAVPGVNGATVALLFRIYTRIMDALKNITPVNLINLIKNLFLVRRYKNRKDLILLVQKMEFSFLVPLAVGSLISIWVLSGFIPQLALLYPDQFHAFVFGVVLVSTFIPLSHIQGLSAKHCLIVLLSAICTFVLVSMPSSNAGHDWLFVYGALSACALLLPGLSGSYLLQVFGQYEYVLRNLHEAFSFNLSALAVIALFVLGMITGIVLFAKLLSWLLHHHQSVVMAVLAGLTIGALRALWPFRAMAEDERIASLLGIMCLGGIVMTLLIVGEGRQKKKNAS